MHYILQKSNFVEHENHPDGSMEIVTFTKIKEIAKQILIQTKAHILRVTPLSPPPPPPPEYGISGSPGHCRLIKVPFLQQ